MPLPERSLFLAIISSLGWGLGGPAQGQVSAVLGPLEVRVLGDYPGHPGHHHGSQSARLDLGKISYVVKYCACMDSAHGGMPVPLEGYIGMPEPSAANWYHSGFLFIQVNGQDVGSTPLSSMTLAERGERGIVDMVWYHQLAAVRVRFLGLANHDMLYCEITLEPRGELETVTVHLRCYPSFFTAAYGRNGARRIETPGTVVSQGERVTLPAAEHWWALYSDAVFDVGRGAGEGPCAMMILPQEASEVTFAPGSYAVNTTVTYPPGTTRMRLAFWDFKGMTNADALARMGEGAQTDRAELETLDFTPAAVRGFNVAALRQQLARAMSSPEVQALLGDRMTEVRDWMEQLAPKLEEDPRNLSIAGQENLLRAVDRYYSFQWEVMLAELLAGL